MTSITATGTTRSISGAARVRHITSVGGAPHLAITAGGRGTVDRAQRERISIWDLESRGTPSAVLDLPLAARHGWITSLHAARCGDRLLIAFTDSKGHLEVRSLDGEVVLEHSSRWRATHDVTLVDVEGTAVVVAARGKKVIVASLPPHRHLRQPFPPVELRQPSLVRKVTASVIDGLLHVVSRGADDVVRHWAISPAALADDHGDRGFAPLQSIVDPRDTPYSHALAIGRLADGIAVATGAADQVVRCWDARTGLLLVEGTTPRPIRALAVGIASTTNGTSDGVLSAICSEGSIHAWDMASRARIPTDSEVLEKTSAATISVGDGRLRALSGGKDGQLRFRDLRLGSTQHASTGDR